MSNDLFSWAATEKAQALMAGALGGVVRWLTLREDWRSGLISITVGAICSLYLSPLAIPIVEPLLGKLVIDPSARAGFSGFIMGIGGIAATGFLIDLWNAKRAQRKGDGP
jgi:hypothetical protein